MLVVFAWFARSSRKKDIGVRTSFDVTLLSRAAATRPVRHLQTMVARCQNAKPVPPFLNNLVDVSRRTLARRGSVRYNAFAQYVVVHSIPSSTILYRTPLSTGKCNICAQYMYACYAIYKVVISGNGERLVSVSFPTLHKHKLQ